MNGSSVQENYMLPMVSNCGNRNCGNANCNGGCGGGDGGGQMVGYYDGPMQKLPHNFVDYSRTMPNGYAADGMISKSLGQHNGMNINPMFDAGAMQSSMMSPGTRSQMINANSDFIPGHQISSGGGRPVYPNQFDACHPTAMPNMVGSVRVRGQTEAEFGGGGAFDARVCRMTGETRSNGIVSGGGATVQRTSSYPPTSPPQRVVPYPNPQQYMMTKRAQYNGLRRQHQYDPTMQMYGGGALCPPRLPHPHLHPPSQQQQQPAPLGYPGVNVLPQQQQVKEEQNNPYLQMGMHNNQSQPSSSSSSWGNSVQFKRESVEFSPPPGNPTPPMTPGLSSVPCNAPSMTPGGGGGGASVFSLHVKPESSTETRTYELRTTTAPVDEPRFTFVMCGGSGLQPFQLEHNLPTTSHFFTIQDQLYETLVCKPDLELVLRCFHKERPMNTNWPASIHIRLNGVPLPVDRGDTSIHRPLHLKSLCRPGQNVLEISVTACCCSHLFLMETVQRPTVRSILHGLLNKRLLPARKSIAKIKQILSATNDQSSIVSLTCPLSGNSRHMVLPTRGHNCRHIACFDLESYLTMNCERSNWMCPICHKPAGLERLEVDQHIWAILVHLSSSCADAVVVNASGNWKIFQKNGTGVNKDTKKYISVDGMVLPTPSTYFASRFPAPDPQQGTSVCSGVHSNGNSQEKNQRRGGPAESDYLGCLSELGNIFLPMADNSPNNNNNAGHQSNGGGGVADHISFPPTPLSSQIGQICTPLDGQSLHPRTPSDGNATHPHTPPDGLAGYPCTPHDSQSAYPKTPNDGGSHESIGNNPRTPAAYDSSCMNNGGKIGNGLVVALTDNRGTAAVSATDGRGTVAFLRLENVEKTGKVVDKSEFSAVHGQSSSSESRDPTRTSDFDGEPFTEMMQMTTDNDDQDMLNFLPDDFDDDPSELASYLGPESRAPVNNNNNVTQQQQQQMTNHKNDAEDNDLLSFLS